MQPITRKKLTKMRQASVNIIGVQTISLIQQDKCDCPMAAEPFEEALVQCRVGILLWVDDPAEHIDDLHQTFDLGAMR